MLQRSFGAILLALAALAAGCSTMDLKPVWPLPGAEPKPKVPSKISDLWTETMLTQPGHPPIRGFGGRIVFYDESNKKATAVEGELTVYAFDAAEMDPVHVSAERKFVFRAEDLKRHYSNDSKIGPSYSLWIPWDRMGGPQRDLKLVCRFEAKSGEVVLSEPSPQTLSGTPPARSVKAQAGPAAGATAVADGVRPVSHEEPLPAASRGAVTTLTMDVPPTFALQSARGGVQEISPAQKTESRPAATPAAAATPSATSAQPGAAPAEATEPGVSVSYGPRRFPARRAPTALPKHDPVRRQPLPGSWPSALPPTPRSETSAPTNDIPVPGALIQR